MSEFSSDTQSGDPLEIIPIALLGDRYHDEMVEDAADPGFFNALDIMIPAVIDRTLVIRCDR